MLAESASDRRHYTTSTIRVRSSYTAEVLGVVEPSVLLLCDRRCLTLKPRAVTELAWLVATVNLRTCMNVLEFRDKEPRAGAFLSIIHERPAIMTDS